MRGGVAGPELRESVMDQRRPQRDRGARPLLERYEAADAAVEGDERDGIDFNLTYIPQTFNTPHLEEFDTNYMQQLYAVGRQVAQTAYPWHKYPPGFEARPTAEAK